MAAHPNPRWCSIRLRLSPEEVALLKGAEAVYGDTLSRKAHPGALREALTLMKATRKVADSGGAAVALGEAEAVILAAAVRHTQQSLERYRDILMGWHPRQAVEPDELGLLERAFPQASGSAWETSRLVRGYQSLATRLRVPLTQP